MTYEEAKKLREEDLAKTLRCPKGFSEDKVPLSYLIYYIERLLETEQKLVPSFIRRLAFRKVISEHENVVDFHCKNAKSGIYFIDIGSAKGEFFDAHRLFKSGKYPKGIEKNQCFGNSVSFALTLNKMNAYCKVLTGVAFYGNPYLHSVVEIINPDDKRQIIDFNSDLVMDYDLYMTLFSFEILCRVDNSTFVRDLNILRDKRTTLDMSHLLLAYDDVIRVKTQQLSSLKNGESV